MSDEPRQRIERVAGGRRVRLTPVPGTIAEPLVTDEDEGPSDASEEAGPNDTRLRQDVPPHY